ncbi:MAG: hypothetical protein ABJE66_04580 [Deltaproteobacteria bacterium]
MNDIAEQRPLFFEGEYLSASDLAQLVIYLRDQSSRHLVGAHTWGIVAGLQLLEQPVGNGTVDMFLLPGYAIDGYGRPIVVVNPVRLSIDRFNGQPSGPVQVWLRYDEAQTNATRPGFQVCCNGGDAYSRVAESYDYEVGFKSLANQQAGISVGGETVDDARTAQQVFNNAGQIVCDASIPYQDLPLADDTKSYWLIPVGEVGWKAGTPGQFVSLTDSGDPTGAKVIHSRRVRRYAGVVAENVYAADGLIRLRRRTTDVVGDEKAIDNACTAAELTGSAYDNAFSNCADGPIANEMVWVEGKVRLTEDTRLLHPGRFELRDQAGTDYFDTGDGQVSVPLFMQREDRLLAGKGYADLQVVIGKAATNTNDYHNRLLIQAASDAEQPTPCQSVQFKTLAPLFTVQDDAKVGIGTDAPDQLLDIEAAGSAFIHLQNTADNKNVYIGAGSHGGVVGSSAGDLRFRTGGDPTVEGSDPTKDPQTHLSISTGGQVGIGTFNPDGGNVLTVEGAGHVSALFRTADQKHEGTLAVNGSGTWLVADSTDDSVVLSTGADTTVGTVWVKPSGNVGIGTATPAHRLGIEDPANAKISLLKSGGPRMVLGSDASGTSIGSTTNHDLALVTNGTNKVMVKTDGKVGIGTDAPANMLDVRGEIRLGAFGQFFAPGGYKNHAVIAGTVPLGALFPVAGPGWFAVKLGLGRYQVQFTPIFAGPAFVTVTLLAGGPVAIPMVSGQDGAGFNLDMWNVGGLDAGFMFIAMAER